MSKELTLAEVSKHNHRGDLYVIVYDKVYDVTVFFDQHPGGQEVLMDLGGQDASDGFTEVDHSHEAFEILEELYVGNIKRVPGDPPAKIAPPRKPIAAPVVVKDAGASISPYAALPVAAAIVLVIYRYMTATAVVVG